MLGAANIWWVPLANIYGRRPVLLATTLVLLLSTIWCGLANNYSSILAARFFQGVGGAAADTISPAIIGDVFFVHERGRAMACYTILLATGSLAGGISGGYIAFRLGWAYLFWVGASMSAAAFLGHVFLVPETLYDREAATLNTTTPLPFSFSKSLSFGRYRGGVVRQFVQPWRTLLLPGTWVVMLHYGGLVGGLVTISTIGINIVAGPPYLWGANSGLLMIGGLVGTVLGAAYTYVVSDRWLKKAKSRQASHAEPEDRLPAMFPALLLATAGFWVFGFCAQYPGKNQWIGLQVGLAMLCFGLMQVPSIGFNYVSSFQSFRLSNALSNGSFS
jgi:MFS family permease